MENQLGVGQFIDRHEDVFTHFERRANRQEYPSIRYLVYLNFGCVLQMNGNTVDILMRTGADTIYHKLHWPDKTQLLDLVNRANAPYKQNVFNKIAIDIMLADYTSLVIDMNLEGIIQMIAHIKSLQIGGDTII